MKKDFISILDISREELANLIAHARKLKEERRVGIQTPVLAHKTLGMIFEKSSTRTRISFEAGMFKLGGHCPFPEAEGQAPNRMPRGQFLTLPGIVLLGIRHSGSRTRHS